MPTHKKKGWDREGEFLLRVDCSADKMRLSEIRNHEVEQKDAKNLIGQKTWKILS